MKLRIIIIASILGLLSACSQPTESAPTLLPVDSLSTAVALTGQAIFATSSAIALAAPVTETPVPTQTPVPATPLPTASPTFEAGFTEYAQIRFLSPGPMSSVISPIKVQLMLVAGESEIVQFDLLGEDGRLLQRVVKRIQHFPNGVFRAMDLLFEVRAVSEVGFIRISTMDKAGRIQALNTMPVLLYSVGSNQINPVGNMIYERVILEGLRDGDDVFGGVLNLKGRYWPFNEQSLFVELLLPNGESITSRIIPMNGIDAQVFETTLPYKVTEPTLARLTFRQDNPSLTEADPELGKNMYVYSMEVILHP